MEPPVQDAGGSFYFQNLSRKAACSAVVTRQFILKNK